MSLLQEFVNLLPLPFNFVVLLTLVICIAGIFTSLINQIRKYACHRQDLDFKREMIDRGMSVDEVERLVQAKGLQIEDEE